MVPLHTVEALCNKNLVIQTCLLLGLTFGHSWGIGEGPGCCTVGSSLKPSRGTQNLVVKFGEICGGGLVENASDGFPQQKKLENLLPNFAGSWPPISPKTSPTSLWKSLVLMNPVISNFYAEALFCLLLRPFALFCGLAFALFQVLPFLVFLENGKENHQKNKDVLFPPNP